MNNHFPEGKNLNISAFSRILDKTTNSYKYLFFLSFVRKISEIKKSDISESEIKLIDIATEMLLLAWFPHRYFKLSLGIQDQCADILNKFLVSQTVVYDNGPITNSKVDRLRKELKQWLLNNNEHLDRLLKYVPYRILTPFYELELKGLSDYKKDSKIISLANSDSNNNISLYRFNKDSILVDKCWKDYIQTNMPIIEGWVKWSWCDYLQNRNSTVPSIPNKILPVLKRISMTKEINYWKDVIKYKDVKCIYTSSKIESFELDHFLPWTFVTHNRLWNLIPVLGEANSSKSNNLPDLSYLDDFIEIQSNAIHVSKGVYSDKKWKKIMEPFISDLNISSYSDLLDESILDKAYKSTILPLYEIAKTNGFSSGWLYKRR